VKVETIADLGKLRHALGRKAHDDERQFGNVVTLFRDGSKVGRVICATPALAWDALRIAAGIRYRVEDGPALDALPLILAA
jgi:hypothetical protein